MRNFIVAFVINILLIGNSLAQTTYPKYEFRGAWIATVTNLDWPSSPGLPVETQQQQLINLLDKLKEAGINAVIFQIRPECDALYNSSIEPWSYWLTGQQGRAPTPFYDPLEFAIQEAHKRGMELHAWFNPYRAVKTIGSYAIAPSHVSVTHPDWVITKGSLKFLNPGLREVREYILSVIRDVLERYNVDGIHFDDYFYPYPPDNITTEDYNTYLADPRGFTNIEDWRRDNVNLLVAQVYDLIKQIKPGVKFGISPFGIWKNGVPTGITGMSAYSTIYCDALAWLKAGTVDYLAPQCYWKIGGSQDYSKLVPWWAQQTSQNNRHLYVGQIFNSSYSNTELVNQVAINRSTPGVQGNILFRAYFISQNTFGFATYLKNEFHKYPALTPQMPWRDSTPPNAPRNIAYKRDGNNVAVFSWDYPMKASDGDSAKLFAIYRFRHNNYASSDLSNPFNLIDLTFFNKYIPAVPDSQGPYWYVITALDAYSNESSDYVEIMVEPPIPPLAIYPKDNVNVRDTLTLIWQPQSLDSEYDLIYSPDPNFTQNVYNISKIRDTVKTITNLEGQKIYYWKIRSGNAGGRSEFSEAYTFFTAFPTVPAPLTPAHASTYVSVNPTLIWSSAKGAEKYNLQLAKSLDFNPSSIALNIEGIADTFITIGPLEFNRTYYWRVKGVNDFGMSAWSTGFRFKTIPQTEVVELANIPTNFKLYNNYPNPFNATTAIEFDLPKAGWVELTVFDVNGNQISTILKDYLNAGKYKTFYDGSSLASGIYFYQLKSGDYLQTNKMVIIK